VIGCVFSGNIPSSYINGGGNVGHTITDSYVIRHLNTFLCPISSNSLSFCYAASTM
jgi:hypothetical protein